MSLSTTKLQELFSQAVRLSPDEMPDFLAVVQQECPKTGERLKRLLIADERNQEKEFLEWPETRQDSGTKPSRHSSDSDTGPMIGRVVDGYQIVERIGAGVTGIVYRAVSYKSDVDELPESTFKEPPIDQRSANREVAIKVLRSWQHDEQGLERFRQEARSLSRIEHPNIAGLITTGMLDDTPYIVMPFISGHTLNQELEERPTTDLETRIHWFMDVCQAIASAHQNQVIHRDLKPSNIIITIDHENDRRAVVTDFGIGKAIDPDSTHGLTRTGELLGTPRFMAPEQFDGSRGVNALADVYGLGAVLYYLIAGQPPFAQVQVFDVAHSVRNSKPIEPSKIRALQPKEKDLETICLKCLNAQPELRYQSVPELMADVDRWKNKRPIKAKSNPLHRRFHLWIQANPRIAALSLALVFTALGSIVGLTYLWQQATKASNVAQAESAKAEKTNEHLIAILQKQIEFEEDLRDQPEMLEARIGILNSVSAELQRIEQELELDENMLRTSAVVWYNLARFENGLRREGNTLAEAESRRRFEELATRFPANLDYQFSLFHWHNLFGDADQAYWYISELVKQDSDNSDYADCFSTACYQRGRALFIKGQFKMAAEVLSQGIHTTNQLLQKMSVERRPFFEKNLIRQFSMRARVNWARNQSEIAQRDIERAIACGEKLTSQSPQDVEILMAYADALIYATSASMFDGDWRKAEKLSANLVEILDRVQPLCPTNYRLWGSCSNMMLHNWMLAKKTGNHQQRNSWETRLLAHLRDWEQHDGDAVQLAEHKCVVLLGTLGSQTIAGLEEMIDKERRQLPRNSTARILFAIVQRDYSRANQLLADWCREPTDSKSELGFREIHGRLIQHFQEEPLGACEPFELTESEKNFAQAFSASKFQFQLDSINQFLCESNK